MICLTLPGHSPSLGMPRPEDKQGLEARAGGGALLALLALVSSPGPPEQGMAVLTVGWALPITDKHNPTTDTPTGQAHPQAKLTYTVPQLWHLLSDDSRLWQTNTVKAN